MTNRQIRIEEQYQLYKSRYPDGNYELNHGSTAELSCAKMGYDTFHDCQIGNTFMFTAGFAILIGIFCIYLTRDFYKSKIIKLKWAIIQLMPEDLKKKFNL